jgi:hypothetical protein
MLLRELPVRLPELEDVFEEASRKPKSSSGTSGIIPSFPSRFRSQVRTSAEVVEATLMASSIVVLALLFCSAAGLSSRAVLRSVLAMP